MRRLIILRHSKTEPAGGPKRDSDRVLVERGRRDAAATAHYFVSRGHTCGLVLCSTSARTRETLSIFQPVACPGARVEFREDLYLAEAPDILSVLRSLDDKVTSVMVVGHNPGLAELALTMCMPPLSVEQEERHRRMRDKFSTSSLAVIGFDAPGWRGLRPGSGVLEDFMRPRDFGHTGE